jgi:hypothetical protein
VISAFEHKRSAAPEILNGRRADFIESNELSDGNEMQHTK